MKQVLRVPIIIIIFLCSCANLQKDFEIRRKKKKILFFHPRNTAVTQRNRPYCVIFGSFSWLVAQNYVSLRLQ